MCVCVCVCVYIHEAHSKRTSSEGVCRHSLCMQCCVSECMRLCGSLHSAVERYSSVRVRVRVCVCVIEAAG